MNQIEQEINNWAVMSVKGSSLTRMLNMYYAGEWSPVKDYLLDILPEGSPDYQITESGVWFCTLAEWKKCGRRIVRLLPLVRVELTDRAPDYTDTSEEYRDDLRGQYCWFLSDYDIGACDYHLPPSWYPTHNKNDWIPAGKTFELALANASSHAIAWARKRR